VSSTSLSFFDDANEQWFILDTNEFLGKNSIIQYWGLQAGENFVSGNTTLRLTSEEINNFLYPEIVGIAAVSPGAPTGSKLYLGSINITNMVYVNSAGVQNSSIELYYGSQKLFPI
jgi:hypothetical protein